MLPQYLRLNEAIEQLTADMVAHDPGAFRSGGADLRRVAERQLFFALFPDRQLYDYFVACEGGGDVPDEDELSIWGRQIAPYLRGARPKFAAPPSLKLRVLRYLHRLHGKAVVQIEGCSVPPEILFVIIHTKFVRYLKPIADRLSVPYAFMTVDDPAMFAALAGQGLPRVHIELNADSVAMTTTEVKILDSKFKPGLFDSWIIRFNAIRRALKRLDCRCVVVPEGNAAIYELVNQSARAIGVSTVCIQQGWAPVVHPGFRNMSYSRMCVWGDEFARMLAPYNPAQNFVVTGNHVVPREGQGNVNRRKAVAFFLQYGAHWLTAAAWRATLEFVIWVAERFPDFEVRVREHPGAPVPAHDAAQLAALKNVKLMPPGAFSLSDALAECRVALAINSTTLLEAAAGGVVPIILDVSGFGPYHPEIAAEGAAIEVTTFDDARTALERLLTDDAYCASFSEPLENASYGLFARNGDQALAAIVREIQLAAGLQSPPGGDIAGAAV